MPSRPVAICLTNFILILVMSIEVHAASADVEVYNVCMKKELAQLQNISMYCGAMNANAANTSANPGSASDAGPPVDGIIQECIRTAEANLRQGASKKCEELAHGAAYESNTDVEPVAPQEVKGITACRGPNCGNTIPQKVPIPGVRPTNPAAAKPHSKQQPPARAEVAESLENQTPQDPEVADVDASGDLNLCESSFSAANLCCGNPTSCLGELSAADQRAYAQLNSSVNAPPAGGQGLTDYCQQMRSLGSSGSDVNVSLAGVCNSKRSSCSSVCSQLANKYLNLISTCNGCASQSIYESTYARLNSRNSSCNALAGRVNQIAGQAVNGSSSAAYGNICNQVAAASPQSGMSAGLPLTNGNATLDSLNCTRNPNNEACRALAANEARGTAAFGSVNQGPGKFNIPPSEEPVEIPQPKNFEPQTVANQTVPNNSGGGIPGAGNETSARFGSTGRTQPSPGSPGYSTDILQGTQGSGGYSAPVGGVQTLNDPDGQHRGQKAEQDGDGGFLGMDLRQFLPGGSRDPRRRIAGIGGRSEINAKEEDIWRRISNKIEEKCRLGILFGCR